MLALNQSINTGIEYSIYTHVSLHMIKEKISKGQGQRGYCHEDCR